MSFAIGATDGIDGASMVLDDESTPASSDGVERAHGNASVGYDPLNRITVSVDPLGGTTRFTYDGNGDLLAVADPQGNATTYTYDVMDRVTTRSDRLGHGESLNIRASCINFPMGQLSVRAQAVKARRRLIYTSGARAISNLSFRPVISYLEYRYRDVHEA